MRALFFLVLLLSAPMAGAAQSLAQVRSAAEAYVRDLAAPGAEIRAEALDARVRLPDCATALQTSGDGAGNGRWTVAVSCGGPQSWSLYVPVRAISRAPVAVAARNLAAGSVLAAGDLRLEPRDTAALPQGHVLDPAPLIGRPLRRPLAAGAVLTPAAVGQVTAVKRGQLVTLLGRAGGFEVRSRGKALSDGAVGERIRVENSSSRRVVQGLVLADGNVEVPL